MPVCVVGILFFLGLASMMKGTDVCFDWWHIKHAYYWHPTQEGFLTLRSIKN